MIHIRPYQVFSIQDDCSERLSFFMPDGRVRGGTSALESLLLIKLMRCVKPDVVFEFGTFRGDTTRLFLENLPEVDFKGRKRIFTMDLPETIPKDVVFQGTDKIVAENRLIAQNRKYVSKLSLDLVEEIYADSMVFDPGQANLLNKFNYIFIDANHALSYVKKDTENALKMLSDKGAACLVWHDYGNHEFPDLTAYLDRLEFPLYHIEDTTLAFMIRGVEVQQPCR